MGRYPTVLVSYMILVQVTGRVPYGPYQVTSTSGSCLYLRNYVARLKVVPVGHSFNSLFTHYLSHGTHFSSKSQRHASGTVELVAFVLACKNSPYTYGVHIAVLLPKYSFEPQHNDSTNCYRNLSPNKHIDLHCSNHQEMNVR